MSETGKERPESAGSSRWAGFDWTRERYEELIQRLVPGYGAQEATIVDILRAASQEQGEESFRVLELGAGTGLLARALLEALPTLRVTAMDISPVMVAACRETLAPFAARADVVEGDFAVADLGFGYRAAVSRLAIHHLTDVEKAGLYGRVFAALVPGGVFVISDMVAGATPEEKTAGRVEWRTHMLDHGDDPDIWEPWLVGDHDHPATKVAQLAWLEAVGFVDTQTVWEYGGFVMIRARKPY